MAGLADSHFFAQGGRRCGSGYVPGRAWATLRQPRRCLPLRVGAPLPSEKEQPMQWEYRTVDGALDAPALERRLNSLGAEGWELVTCTSPGHYAIHYVLKRAVPPAARDPG